MHPIIPVTNPDQPCAHCPHKASATSDIGHQITQIIDEMTPTEREQMLVLINNVLTASRLKH